MALVFVYSNRTLRQKMIPGTGCYSGMPDIVFVARMGNKGVGIRKVFKLSALIEP